MSLVLKVAEWICSRLDERYIGYGLSLACGLGTEVAFECYRGGSLK